MTGSPTLKKTLLYLFASIFFYFFSFTTIAAEKNIHIPVFKQEFDWLKLTSDEWLKGDIVSMYDEVLEFDSDNLDMQSIDWEDVSELRSKNKLSIRLINGTIAEGYLVVKNGKLSLTNNGIPKNFTLSHLISIASSGEKESDLWDGYLNLGANFRRGNTTQFDYTIGAGIQRRSSSSRFKTDYIANYSRFEDQETDVDSVTEDSTRLTSVYDWFFSKKIFFRAMDFEYFSDEFLNIDYRLSYGVGAGYKLIDNSRTSWDVNAGPSYQITQFKNVAESESNSETSPGLVLGTNFSYEVTNDIDFEIYYQLKFVNETSGKYLHYLATGLDIELTGNFDLEVMLYVDRTKSPRPDENNITPQQNDYRFVVSLGYDF